MNHILMLSGSRVYVFGDKSKGCLGNTFKNDDKVSRVDWEKLTCLNKRNVEGIFVTDYCSFIKTKGKKNSTNKSEKMYCFGLNNY